MVLALPIPRKITSKLLEGEKSKLLKVKPGHVSKKTIARLEKLAVSKSLHPDFQPNQEKVPPVTKAALKAVASPRVVELSAPPSRKLIKDTFEPFKVNPSTQHVVASDRLVALSKPKKYTR